MYQHYYPRLAQTEDFQHYYLFFIHQISTYYFLFSHCLCIFP
ncbi:Protein of unknown function [Pyronema omphalodes CBS 100304]|uniref:Uncharacterized protein n=1 Tax=Pyronema omphalodes (strain CBS 100304) TaxID=1076935 RepID=U4LUT9_PYROM|nr:Protein of unknown function [Pyronema omphalodes CBS 100304]